MVFYFVLFYQDEESRKQVLFRPQEESVMEKACGVFKIMGWAVLSKENTGLEVGIPAELRTS